MRRYDVRCEELHVNEVEFSTFKDADAAFDVGVPCPECGKPTERIIRFKSLGILYNCGGFYGSVPTDLAHATGQV